MKWDSKQSEIIVQTNQTGQQNSFPPTHLSTTYCSLPCKDSENKTQK